MTRARTGTTLLCIAAALAFGTVLAWKFSTQSEAKAQYRANVIAAANGEPAREIDPNRTPAYLVAGITASVLAVGLVLRRPGPTPITPMSNVFWGRTDDDAPPAPEP